MKTIILPKAVFFMIVFVLLAGMAIFLWLTYVQYTQPDAVVLPSHIGTLAVDADWRVRLKDNPFYPSNELNSDYAYVSSLVDQLIIDLNFNLTDGIENEAALLDCRVDGDLVATYGATSNSVLLLEQKYPKLKTASIEDLGPAFTREESFSVNLTPYNYVIDSFQSSYQVSVTAQLQLNMLISIALSVKGETVTENTQLTLTIPLGNTVFQIAGTPSVTLDMFMPAGNTSGVKTARRTIEFSIYAGALAILALLCYLFFEPGIPDKYTAQLNQVLQQVKNRIAKVTTDPKQDKWQMIGVSSINDLVTISDDALQPILHFESDSGHRFYVLNRETLFEYSILKEALIKPSEPETSTPESTSADAPPPSNFSTM